MTNDEMFYLARQAVVNYFNETADTHPLKIDDTYIVWFNYTLKNFKALVGTNVHDGMYYEVTYNAAAKQIYLDAYKKWQKKILDVLDDEPPVQEPAVNIEPVQEEVIGGEEEIPFQEEPKETTNE